MICTSAIGVLDNTFVNPVLTGIVLELVHYLSVQSAFKKKQQEDAAKLKALKGNLKDGKPMGTSGPCCALDV